MPDRSLPLAALLVSLGMFAPPPPAYAGTEPAQEALREIKEGRPAFNVVQNRFFLKAQRFEIAPIAGYVPNNAFVKRYMGGVEFAYHLSESVGIEGMVVYSPDLGEDDLKGLTNVLVQIAEEGGSGTAFTQPVDKLTLGAAFNARWAPLYGKINLIGERVLNFDAYLTGGLGVLSIRSYDAEYSDDRVEQGLPPAALREVQDKARPVVNLGFGADFFITSSLAVKLDSRSMLYVAPGPDYDPTDGQEEPARLYNTFLLVAGLSIYFPAMQPRISSF